MLKHRIEIGATVSNIFQSCDKLGETLSGHFVHLNVFHFLGKCSLFPVKIVTYCYYITFLNVSE